MMASVRMSASERHWERLTCTHSIQRDSGKLRDRRTFEELDTFVCDAPIPIGTLHTGKEAVYTRTGEVLLLRWGQFTLCDRELQLLFQGIIHQTTSIPGYSGD